MRGKVSGALEARGIKLEPDAISASATGVNDLVNGLVRLTEIRVHYRLRTAQPFAHLMRRRRFAAAAFPHPWPLAPGPSPSIIPHAPLLPPRDRRVAPRGAARPPQADTELAGDGVDHRTTRQARSRGRQRAQCE